MDLKGKKFVASFSGGKDSVFAVYTAIKRGLCPLKLITTFNTDRETSWFHAIPESLLQEVASSIGIPVKLIKTSGEAYAENFEAELIRCRDEGAEVCVFGDIDIEEHRIWCSERCVNTGLTPFFPLWGRDRRQVVSGFLDAGFKTVITAIDVSRVPEHILGKTLSHSVALEIEQNGADMCGENGEFHTFVYDGPIFNKKIEPKFKDPVTSGSYMFLPFENKKSQ
jgi:diphthine-ammonia ligase